MNVALDKKNVKKKIWVQSFLSDMKQNRGQDRDETALGAYQKPFKLDRGGPRSQSRASLPSFMMINPDNPV